VINLKEIGNLEELRDKEYFIGLMEISIKETGMDF
jgi:hypothetical protein